MKGRKTIASLESGYCVHTAARTAMMAPDLMRQKTNSLDIKSIKSIYRPPVLGNPKEGNNPTHKFAHHRLEMG